MATNFSVKIGENWHSETDCSIAILTLKKLIICDDLSVMIWLHCENLMNLNPVTPEFKRVVGVHPHHLKMILDQLFTDLHDRIFTIW